MSKHSSNCMQKAGVAPAYVFDEEDANLFLLEDKNLKAKAIRCSIIPRLMELANSAIAEAAELYGVEPLEIATVAYSPRTGESRREHGFKVDFSVASAGLAPVRQKGVYPLLGKDRMIFISGLSFVLDSDGLQVVCSIDCHVGLCRERFFDFFQRHEREIMTLILSVRGGAHVSGPKPPLLHMFPCSLNEKKFISADRCVVYLLDRECKFPIEEDVAQALKHHFVRMYPIFHAFCLLAMGREDEFDFGAAVQMAITHSQKCFEQHLLSDHKSAKARKAIDESSVKALADERVRVMPGKRWQVFERDDWRCVSCGKRAEDGAILEVDHILPRSRGGSDDIANLQTLCRECNIGKSNKNQTDLRGRHSKHVNKKCP